MSSANPSILRIDAWNDDDGAPLWELVRYVDGSALLRIYNGASSLPVWLSWRQGAQLARALFGFDA